MTVASHACNASMPLQTVRQLDVKCRFKSEIGSIYKIIVAHYPPLGVKVNCISLVFAFLLRVVFFRRKLLSNTKEKFLHRRQSVVSPYSSHKSDDIPSADIANSRTRLRSCSPFDCKIKILRLLQFLHSFCLHSRFFKIFNKYATAIAWL